MKANVVNNPTDPEVDEPEDIEEENSDVINCSSKFVDVICPGTYVTLHSPPNSLENFFLFQVTEKGKASEELRDQFGHEVI